MKRKKRRKTDGLVIPLVLDRVKVAVLLSLMDLRLLEDEIISRGADGVV